MQWPCEYQSKNFSADGKAMAEIHTILQLFATRLAFDYRIVCGSGDFANFHAIFTFIRSPRLWLFPSSELRFSLYSRLYQFALLIQETAIW
jgi:hypothetical protein